MSVLLISTEDLLLSKLNNFDSKRSSGTNRNHHHRGGTVVLASATVVHGLRTRLRKIHFDRHSSLRPFLRHPSPQPRRPFRPAPPSLHNILISPHLLRRLRSRPPQPPLLAPPPPCLLPLAFLRLSLRNRSRHRPRPSQAPLRRCPLPERVLYRIRRRPRRGRGRPRSCRKLRFRVPHSRRESGMGARHSDSLYETLRSSPSVAHCAFRGGRVPSQRVLKPRNIVGSGKICWFQFLSGAGIVDGVSGWLGIPRSFKRAFRGSIWASWASVKVMR